jgi:hypothetical protein
MLFLKIDTSLHWRTRWTNGGLADTTRRRDSIPMVMEHLGLIIGGGVSALLRKAAFRIYILRLGHSETFDPFSLNNPLYLIDKMMAHLPFKIGILCSYYQLHWDGTAEQRGSENSEVGRDQVSSPVLSHLWGHANNCWKRPRTCVGLTSRLLFSIPETAEETKWPLQIRKREVLYLDGIMYA